MFYNDINELLAKNTNEILMNKLFRDVKHFISKQIPHTYFYNQYLCFIRSHNMTKEL